MLSSQELKDFELWVKNAFLDGKLRSPVHLSGGNEDELIELFKDIRKEDWVFTTYRSHYHALLKGVPEERLRQWILDNKSIHFMDSEYKVFSSAIVAGCLPIAIGVAEAIKSKNNNIVNALANIGGKDWKVDGDSIRLVNKKHVYIFIGDMTATLGTFHDCLQYAYGHRLPITFIIEDNGKSTDTVTSEVWNIDTSSYLQELCEMYPDYIKYYKYERTYPHYGVGKFVKF